MSMGSQNSDANISDGIESKEFSKVRQTSEHSLINRKFDFDIVAEPSHVFKGDILSKLGFYILIDPAKIDLIMAKREPDKSLKLNASLLRLASSFEQRDCVATYTVFDNNGCPSTTTESLYGISEDLSELQSTIKLEVIIGFDFLQSETNDPQCNFDNPVSLADISQDFLMLEASFTTGKGTLLASAESNPISITEFSLTIEEQFVDNPFVLRLENESSDKEAHFCWHNKCGGENAGIDVKIHLRDSKGRLVKDHCEMLSLTSELIYMDHTACPFMPLQPLKRRASRTMPTYPLYRPLRAEPVLEPRQATADFCFRIEEVSATHAQKGGKGKSGFKLKVSIEDEHWSRMISPGIMDEVIVVRSKARKDELEREGKGSFPYQKALDEFREKQEQVLKTMKNNENGSIQDEGKNVQAIKRPFAKRSSRERTDYVKDASEDPCLSLVSENGMCLWCHSQVSTNMNGDEISHEEDCAFASSVFQEEVNHPHKISTLAQTQSKNPSSPKISKRVRKSKQGLFKRSSPSSNERKMTSCIKLDCKDQLQNFEEVSFMDGDTKDSETFFLDVMFNLENEINFLNRNNEDNRDPEDANVFEEGTRSQHRTNCDEEIPLDYDFWENELIKVESPIIPLNPAWSNTTSQNAKTEWMSASKGKRHASIIPEDAYIKTQTCTECADV